MTFVTFTSTGTTFESTLAQKAIDNGWTRCEVGYNWIKPVGSNNVCLGKIYQLGAIRIYTELSVTGYLYTIFEPAVRESYDSGTHLGIGLGWVGWGNPIYWLGKSENDVARDFIFEGWIDDHSIIGNVKPDSSIGGATVFPIFFCVTKGFDGVNRLVGLDMMPNTTPYRCNARLIYATDSLAYWMGLQGGGLGVWGFDNKARLSRLYFFRGGTAIADVINPAAIIGSFEDPDGIPYVLCSKHQGAEVYQDQCVLDIEGTNYYYKMLYGVLTPPQSIMLTEKNSNFNAITVPSKVGVDRILIYWVRCL